MKKLLTLIAAFAILMACNNPHADRIAQIDGLIAELDSAEMVLNSIDTGKIYRRYDATVKNIFQLNFYADTLDRKNVFLVDEYYNYQKAYRKTIGKLGSMFESIEVIPMQLKNLKKDLSKNLIDENTAYEYLRGESLAAKGLSESIYQVKNGMQRIDTSYIRCEEKILHLIERLQAEKPAEEHAAEEHIH